MKYQHIFFDLDHTLWDFERNSQEVLKDLLKNHKLQELGIPDYNHFIGTFETVNSELWNLYNKNKINRDMIRKQRFVKVLATYKIEDSILCEKLSTDYLMMCPQKPHVFPDTFDTLDYLKDKYVLHILTNGFNDVQYIKLESSKLAPYFTTVVTSDGAGYKKPQASIFAHAIQKADARKEHSIMIGDNLQTDILGARNFGMDHIYFNPGQVKHNASVTYEINTLAEIKSIL